MFTMGNITQAQRYMYASTWSINYPVSAALPTSHQSYDACIESKVQTVQYISYVLIAKTKPLDNVSTAETKDHEYEHIHLLIPPPPRPAPKTAKERGQEFSFPKWHPKHSHEFLSVKIPEPAHGPEPVYWMTKMTITITSSSYSKQQSEHSKQLFKKVLETSF